MLLIQELELIISCINPMVIAHQSYAEVTHLMMWYVTVQSFLRHLLKNPKWSFI